MKNELARTSASCIETFVENSKFDFNLNGWPAAVTLLGFGVCLTVIGCKYLDTQAAMS